MTAVVPGMAARALLIEVPFHTEATPSDIYSDLSSEAAAIYTEQVTKACKLQNFLDPGGLPSGRLVLRTHCTRAITQCHRRHISPYARIRVSGPRAASQLQGLSPAGSISQLRIFFFAGGRQAIESFCELLGRSGLRRTHQLAQDGDNHLKVQSG